MKKIIFPFLATLLVFLTACEEQPIKISQEVPNTDRTVFVEEFTGANCAACPAGAKTIEDLKNVYGDNIVSVAIHTTKSGPLGTPLPGSAYDLRTQEGDDLFDHFGGLTGIPAAVINRTKFEGQSRLGINVSATWPNFIESELTNEPLVEVSTLLDYNSDTRDLSIIITVLPLEDLSGDFRVAALITESHIIDKQNNNGTIEDDYEHNHVLRKVISSIEGDALTSTLVTNTPIQKTYIYQLPPEDGIWVAGNISVITFVSVVDSDAGTINILQADEAHLDD